MEVWSCRSHHASAKCHSRVTTCFCVFVTSCPGPGVSSATLAPRPWPYLLDEKGTSLPCPETPSLASSFYTLGQLSSKHHSWESVDPPENPACPSLTLSALLLCLDNIHSSDHSRYRHITGVLVFLPKQHIQTPRQVNSVILFKLMPCFVF